MSDCLRFEPASWRTPNELVFVCVCQNCGLCHTSMVDGGSALAGLHDKHPATSNRPRMGRPPVVNHYTYLEQVLPRLLVGITKTDVHAAYALAQGLISAHGDKAYSYRTAFEQAGLSFEQGVLLYLLTYVQLWAKECRETAAGWVAPEQWVVSNKQRFMAAVHAAEQP